MDLKTEKHTKLRFALRKAGSGLAFLAFAVSARADLVQNGSFEQTTCLTTVPSGFSCLAGQFGDTGGGAVTSVADWTTTGYNFVYAPGVADGNGSYGNQYGANALWGPGNGSANGLPATSPDGGNFVAADGDFESAPIQQTINGLVPGQQYTVGFWWAASQQYGFNGPTVQYWSVSLGGETENTPAYDLPSHGFSGWMFQTFNFTVPENGSSSEVLAFLAVGNVQLPPFLLLDGVSLNQTPEPGYWIPGVGLLGLMAGIRVLRSKKLAKS
jgi:hypothetical protein